MHSQHLITHNYGFKRCDNTLHQLSTLKLVDSIDAFKWAYLNNNMIYMINIGFQFLVMRVLYIWYIINTFKEYFVLKWWGKLRITIECSPLGYSIAINNHCLIHVNKNIAIIQIHDLIYMYDPQTVIKNGANITLWWYRPLIESSYR